MRKIFKEVHQKSNEMVEYLIEQNENPSIIVTHIKTKPKEEES